MTDDLFGNPNKAGSALSLPPVVFGPIKTTIGQIRQVLRLAEKVTVISVEEIRISPRRKGQLLKLSNGEAIVIAGHKRNERPAEADGVLLDNGDGKFSWIAHKLTEAAEAEVTAGGLPSYAKKVGKGWDGKFAFKTEQLGPDGDVIQSGLRPPQIGALHSIGAHWSLSRQPATIVMPTGTGKTETMLSALAAYVRGPLLVVVPSDILRSQTASKFLTLGLLRKLGVLLSNAPNPVVGVVTRRPQKIEDLEILEKCNVIIGTMSALGEGKAEALSKEIAIRVDTLIVDEAHHISAAGWTRFREAFLEDKVLQFTATPFRRDGKLVDGQVIYSYPLRKAQSDGYFKKIAFEPIFEVNPEAADRVLANAAIDRLKADLGAGLNHLLMARCSSIDRAEAVYAIYREIAADQNPMLVHSEMGETDTRIAELRAGKSRIVVCVNMLGEGFDLPELKIAALHDLHKSLAVLLQFTGRFTRTAGNTIGDATILANIADPNVTAALERLYSEDADWNQVLSELSSDAAKEHAELIAFLGSAQRLDSGSDDESTAVSHQLLRPTLSTLMYKAAEFHPKRFHEGLPEELELHRVWLHQPSNTLFFVTKSEPAIKWTRSRALRDRLWALFVLHYDAQQKLLFLSSSDHSSTFEPLAKAVGATEQVFGDVIFRTLGKINRLVFQNVGVKKHGRRNLRFAMYTGADVATALGLAEQAGSVKSNLSGTGWEDGRPVTIGCSYKGRVWSREQGAIPRFVKWTESVGAKVTDDTIDTRNIIANVLIPEECQALPSAQVLAIEWPVELLAQSEERVTFRNGANEQSISMFDLQFFEADAAASSFEFDLVEALSGSWGRYQLTVGGEGGYRVERTSDQPVMIKVGAIVLPVEQYFTDYPPLVRFVDLSELDGNLLVRPNTPRDLVIPEDRFDPWDWQGVDLAKESLWKEGLERQDSIQWRAARHFIDEDFDVVFDDDAAGEAADLVCLRDCGDYIRLCLVHCKFAGGAAPGERVKDVMEVCSQAVRSSKWKWKFRDLARHIHTRESKLAGNGRNTRFLKGHGSDLNRIVRVSRLKEIRAEIMIVQPGLSKRNRTPEQTTVLAAALSFLKETIGVDLDIICSE